ncbi:MAG: acyltransferase [Patescibacteria group bacterium]
MKKLWHFEGLRCILVIVVFLHHFAAAFYPAMIFGLQQFGHSPWERWVYATPLAVVLDGRLAVFVFFVLTGFFIIHERNTSTRNITVWRFTVSRYFRLVLPSLASTVLAYIFIRLGTVANVGAAQITRSPWLSNVLPSHPNLVTAITEGVQSPWSTQIVTYNFNLWPIQMFFIGSLVIFLLSRWWKRGTVRTLGWAAIALISIGTQFASFFLGALLADLFSALTNRNRPTLSWAAVASGVMLGFFTLLLGSVPTMFNSIFAPGTSPATMNVVFNTVAAGLIVSGVLLSHGWQRILSRPPLVAIGQMSFSLYVIHLLVIATVSTNIFLAVTPYLAYDGAVAVTFALTVIAVAIVTPPFYRYVERPSHRLAEKIKIPPEQNNAPDR